MIVDAAPRTASILLVEVDPRIATLLHQSELGRATTLCARSEPQALRVVEQPACGVEAVLVGAAVAQPIHLAQTVHAIDPDLAVVILTAPARHAAIVRAVHSTPLLGREVLCHPFTDDVNALVQTLHGAALATRSRRTYRDASREDVPGAVGSARYLGTLLETTPMGVVEVDGTGRVLGLNRMARTLLETTERDTIGAHLQRLFAHGTDWERLVREGASAPRVVERTRRSGEPQALEVTIGDAPSASSGARYLVLLTDVTQRVRAERSLRFLVDATVGLDESLDVLKTAERVAGIAVPHLADWCAIDMREDGVHRRVGFAHADPAWAETAAVLARYPFRAAGALRDPLATGRTELVPEVPAALLDALAEEPLHREALAAQAPRALLAVPIHAHGRPLGIMTLVASRPGRRFEPSDVALAEDLARRAGFAMENARLFEELRRADRAKDEFLAMLAHELRNPLAPIVTATRLLAQPARSGDARALDVIERQTRHMARIVDDLLDVSRIARGKIQVVNAPLDLAQVAREVAGDFRGAAAHVGIALEVDADEPCPVAGDRTRLSQVFGNLLSNAIKFTPRGGRIDVRAERRGDRGVVTVADTGVGLVPELLRAVFEPFAQADRTLERTRGGLGLGLAIVRGIVELHGGRVVAQSEGPGKGASFSVELPLDATGAAPPAAPAPAPSAAPATRMRRVLIIDDNVDLALTLKDLLEDMGHQVSCANDGAQGVALAREATPDLVFCDIGLPGMNGYDVASALRREPALSKTQLVALTGYGREQDRARAFEAGFDEYVTKPMPIATLERILGA